MTLKTFIAKDGKLFNDPKFLREMVSTLQVLTKDPGEDLMGDINENIDFLDFEVSDETLVISHRNGDGLDFSRGDIRVEIESPESIKLAWAKLYGFKLMDLNSEV